jgi:hypothetical protein
VQKTFVGEWPEKVEDVTTVRVRSYGATVGGTTAAAEDDGRAWGGKAVRTAGGGVATWKDCSGAGEQRRRSCAEELRWRGYTRVLRRRAGQLGGAAARARDGEEARLWWWRRHGGTGETG